MTASRVPTVLPNSPVMGPRRTACGGALPSRGIPHPAGRLEPRHYARPGGRARSRRGGRENAGQGALSPGYQDETPNTDTPPVQAPKPGAVYHLTHRPNDLYRRAGASRSNLRGTPSPTQNRRYATASGGPGPTTTTAEALRCRRRRADEPRSQARCALQWVATRRQVT